MKVCDYCGRENDDDVLHCRECGTQQFKNRENEAPDTLPECTAPELPEPEPSGTHIAKVCDYCGRENDRDAVHCHECGTLLRSPQTEAAKVLPESTTREPPNLESGKLTSDEMKLDFVTLLTCRTLIEADMVIGQLGSVGIPAFIPDEFLAQAMSWNVNAFGYVRVQVSPKDYERAKTFLREMSELVEPGAPPNGGPTTPFADPGVAEGPPSVS